jgi:hypothetical protein
MATSTDERNHQTSAREVAAFVSDPPARYFAYVKADLSGMRQHKLTTWTGDFLGDLEMGHPWRDNLGSVRVPVRVRAINGRTYYGTYFKSAGDYCRLKVCKS